MVEKGYIVDTDYLEIDGNTFVQLFGRLENGKSFAILNKFEPYFFIKEKDLKKCKKLLKNYKFENFDSKTFSGEKTVKIFNSSFSAMKKLSEILHKEDLETFEADIQPHMRFIMDKDIKGTIEIDGEPDKNIERVDFFYKDVKVEPTFFKPKLKILSLDIESGKSKGELFCIGLYGENFKKTFMITNKKFKNVVSCRSEEECLSKFKEAVLEYDPDIITGWNFIDFDLLYLQDLFRENNMSFDMGRTNQNIRLRIEKDFFRSSSAKIQGRQALDGLNFIRDPFIQEAPSIKELDFEAYNLETVSQKILHEGKLLPSSDRHEEIERLFYSKKDKENQKLIDYNILDCKLVYDILEKTKIVELSVERSQLTGMNLNRITASIASFDSLYIREARKKKLVSPTLRFGNKEKKIIGGYVFSSEPGIYHNVAVLDFKSLYPSIIRTFNIDPSSLLEKKKKGAIESPNKAYFENQEGILPKILDELHSSREKAKKEKRELSSYAIKIIMNSFFGVLASPNCRYFNYEMANSITNFGQMIIKLTSKEIEKLGYKVLYSDTDSVFVEVNKNEKETNKTSSEIQEYINKFYQEYVKKNYGRESFLELEFDKQFLSLMIPAVRGINKKEEDKKAAKKRYAGLIRVDKKEKLVLVGLEAIRGDWTQAAKDFQTELLTKVFSKENPNSFIKKYINDLRAGKLDSSLVYRKSIRKELEEYTKTTPPHVKAARKLDKLESNIIEYYITSDGPEPLQALKHKIDYEHYIDKQIKPIADQVLSLFGKKFEDILKGSKQETLF